ncbi:mechanosensitive ion channel [Dyadobacter flavalbus]|uniref:Mechanosensitive ion channel n=1 Tax=Dyadobacter flavalbus TaxID=2579942 RepID=A0A5M8Q9Q6_9BACT|nr:mechanosensitive ion channel domain-containing protein [Dyadobacter flavalbus]KAA6431576.1 mechanosensitive ion channel [Dyadobacter flavalbus]
MLATFIVLLNLTPLFEPRAPSIYIELNQFLLLMTLTVFFLKMLPPNHLMWWFSVLILYVLVIFSNVIVDASFFLRFLLIGLNVGSILFGIRFYRKLKEVKLEERFIKPILIIYVLLNISAVFLNALGRVTLAKTFNITAISGLIQILSLGVFVHVLTEAMELQIKVSSCSNGIFSRINAQKTRISFQKAMTVISVVLWLLVFFINLNIIDPVFGFLSGILEKPRNFGSITFTLGNVLIFSLILWMSNNLQKNISLFFSGPEVSFTEESVHKGSKLALIRLVIIVIGFLFAITASGVPLDKITVLLGALGVGIGLGMQNIVNNFVSGIILIFEKPFTIGDYIELADKKGKVMDIGIRSSRMLTPQGSSVIIPNGDLLSGRLVNYTTSNARLKSEVVFKINIDSDLEAAKKIINDIIDEAEGIVKKAPRQILFSAISADNVELKIMVWLNDVYSETAFKSYVLEQILIRFKKSEIKVM